MAYIALSGFRRIPDFNVVAYESIDILHKRYEIVWLSLVEQKRGADVHISLSKTLALERRSEKSSVGTCARALELVCGFVPRFPDGDIFP